MKRINVRVFEQRAAAFLPLPTSVVPDHVCIASTYPLTLKNANTNEEISFDLVKLCFISGDHLLVDNSRIVRDTFLIWSAPSTGTLAALSSGGQADGVS